MRDPDSQVVEERQLTQAVALNNIRYQQITPHSHLMED